MSKKIVGIFLSVAIMLTIVSVPALAVSIPPQESTVSSAGRSEIISVLQCIEDDKTAFGLDGVDFCNLQIGNTLHAYEYVNNNFEDLYSAVPILYNDSLIALAIKVDGTRYQISSALALKLANVVDSNIALVYDSKGVYCFTGTDFVLLAESGTIVSSRSDLDEYTSTPYKSMMNLCDLSKVEALGYSSALDSRSYTNAALPVGFVPQGANTRICWAATIACINNYVHKTNLTAKDVAVKKFGSSNYNQGLDMPSCASFMQSAYNLDYTYKRQVPDENVIFSDLSNGYPIFGHFTWSSGSHGVTIYGINIRAGYISVMDPEFGAATASYSLDGYTYISDYSGVKLTLLNAICHGW